MKNVKIIAESAWTPVAMEELRGSPHAHCCDWCDDPIRTTAWVSTQGDVVCSRACIEQLREAEDTDGVRSRSERTLW